MSELALEPPPPPASKRIHAAGFIVGIVYGLFARWAFGVDRAAEWFQIMSVAFIFGVPFALGALTVIYGEQDRRWTWWQRTWRPIVPALLALLGALLLAWEGWICIWFWLPLFVVLAAIGGLLAGVVLSLVKGGGPRQGAALAIAALPFVLAPIEQRIPLPNESRQVDTEIDIDAPPEVVWANIARVPAIGPEEHRFSWSHAIGFPRPVEATLSREGVGGVRHATFEGGVLFVETISVWEERSRLAFSIEADPSTIPPGTLDDHVTVGGPYFDVLEGEYRLEVIGPKRVRLHLGSKHRLSTHFNLYAGFWTDFVMRDVQEAILAILKRRCEAG